MTGIYTDSETGRLHSEMGSGSQDGELQIAKLMGNLEIQSTQIQRKLSWGLKTGRGVGGVVGVGPF